jgi:WXG100 family type VII secretion target
MANQIRMTPETMRTRATEYGRQADTLKDVITTMDNLLNQLQSEWEGAASESYAQKYEELKPGFQKAEQLIRDIQAALNKTAEIVENTDADIASQFRA